MTVWADRFEGGFSQIIVWFWSIQAHQDSEPFESKFGKRRIDASALLVVGRDSGVVSADRLRLEWRRDHVVVASQKIWRCTFDELLRDHIALCSRSTPPSYLDYLRKRHVTAIIAGDDHVDCREAFEQLHERYGVRTLRTDCGGTLNGVLLQAGLVDELSVLVNPSLVGGHTRASLPFVDAPDPTAPDDVLRLRLLDVERVKGDVLWLRYQVIRSS